MAVALPLAALWVLGASASAAPQQTDPSTSTSQPTIDTTEDLLEGSTTVPQTTIDPSSTTLPGDDDTDSPAGDETRTVWLIVLALVVVAFVLAFLTYRYWLRTRPARLQPFDQDRVDDRVDAERRPVG